MALFSDDAAVIAQGTRYLRVEAFILYPFAVPYLLLGLLAFLDLEAVAIWLGMAVVVTASVLVTRWYAGRKMAALRGCADKREGSV